MYVYVMAGDGAAKVGIAVNVRRRFYQARTQRRGLDRIVRQWWCPVGAREVEALACRLVGAVPSLGKEQFGVAPETMIDAVEAAMMRVFKRVLPHTDGDPRWHVGGRPSLELLTGDPDLGPIIAGWFKPDLVKETYGIKISHALAQKYTQGLGRRRRKMPKQR